MKKRFLVLVTLVCCTSITSAQYWNSGGPVTITTLSPYQDLVIPNSVTTMTVSGDYGQLDLTSQVGTVNPARVSMVDGGSGGVGSIHATVLSSKSINQGSFIQSFSIWNDPNYTDQLIQTLDNTGRMYLGKNVISWAAPLLTGGSISSLGDYRLYVENGILTEKLKVAKAGGGNWPDYVFADNYELKSLSEVEQFIKENKHLPEVSSAAEVEKDGIDVATMDAQLLKKIEELTLYVIQQQKQIDKQQHEIELLKAKN